MKISALLIVAVPLLVLPAPPAPAQDAFGGSSQDLWIPAQAFMPMTAGESLVYGLSDFYLTVAPPLTTGTFSAPVTLEAGSRIRRVECDFFAAVASEAHVHFRRMLKPPGNAPPLNTDLLHFHTATGTAEYVQVGMDLDHTYQTRAGTATSLYVLDLIMSNDGGNNLRFRGCRVAWNRQVSPAPVLATFTDVPIGDPLHRFVEALVAAGITGGCGAFQYCPDAPLTRGQMAVFLSVALGLHFPY